MNEELGFDARPLDWGFDITLNRSTLAVSPDRRVRRGVIHSRRMMEIQGIAQRA